MISEPIATSGNQYRVTVAWRQGIPFAHVDVMFRPRGQGGWERRHTFFEAGAVELNFEPGHICLAYTPGELHSQVETATIEPVKPPSARPSLEQRLAALERTNSPPDLTLATRH